MVCASASVVSGAGLTLATAGAAASLTIQSKDAYDKTREHVLPSFSVTLIGSGGAPGYAGAVASLPPTTQGRCAAAAGVVEHDVVPHVALARLRHGLSLDGQALKPARVDWQNPEQLRFVLTEGKKRQIRRMCELVGLKVVGLKRVRIGRVILGQLPLGQWRYLGPSERF